MINGQLFGILNTKADELYRIQFNTPTVLDKREKKLLEEEWTNQQSVYVFFASSQFEMNRFFHRCY